MAHRDRVALAKLILIGALLNLMVIGYVFYQSYEGRSDVVTTQRSGCDRIKHDRADVAQLARSVGKIDIADRMDARNVVNCTTAYPKASLLP